MAEGLATNQPRCSGAGKAVGSSLGAAAIPCVGWWAQLVAPYTYQRVSRGVMELALSCQGERKRTAEVPASSDIPVDDQPAVVKPLWLPGIMHGAVETTVGYSDV